MITAVFVLMLLWIVCDTIQDIVAYNYDTSVFRNCNRKYFDPSVSWKNKYKNGNPNCGERFFGSTTFLVWLTDFWHLMKFVKMNLLWIVVAVTTIWWLYFVGIVFHGIIFEIAYRITK